MKKTCFNCKYSGALERPCVKCVRHSYWESKVDGKPKLCDEFVTPKWGPFDIRKVIFNDPATIVLWADGTKTIVKAVDEEFDPEKGLAMAIAKKALGNKGNYFDEIKKWTEPYYEKEAEESDEICLWKLISKGVDKNE